MIEFASGGTGWMLGTDMRKYVVSDMDIFGEKGKLTVILNKTAYYWIPMRINSGLNQKNLMLQKTEQRPENEYPMMEALEQIKKALTGREQAPEHSESIVLKVWKTIEAIKESFKKNKKVYL